MPCSHMKKRPSQVWYGQGTTQASVDPWSPRDPYKHNPHDEKNYSSFHHPYHPRYRNHLPPSNYHPYDSTMYFGGGGGGTRIGSRQRMADDYGEIPFGTFGISEFQCTCGGYGKADGGGWEEQRVVPECTCEFVRNGEGGEGGSEFEIPLKRITLAEAAISEGDGVGAIPEREGAMPEGEGGIDRIKWSNSPRPNSTMDPVSRLRETTRLIGPPDVFLNRPNGIAVWQSNSGDEMVEYPVLEGGSGGVLEFDSLMIRDEMIPHDQHVDFFYATMKMTDEVIDVQTASEIMKISPSVMVDRLAGKVTARCHFMRANIITLALALQVLVHEIDGDTAKEMYEGKQMALDRAVAILHGSH